MVLGSIGLSHVACGGVVRIILRVSLPCQCVVSLPLIDGKGGVELTAAHDHRDTAQQLL